MNGAGTDYVLLVLGMGVVTYLPRWVPLRFLSRRRLPQWFIEWLDLIPVSILSALLLPELITSGANSRQLDLTRPELLVALPTFFFAWKTRSLGGTVLVGMALFWLSGRMF